MRRLAWLLTFVPALCHAQDDRTEWYVRTGPVFGQPVLGSEDTRRGAIYAVGFLKPEPRFTFRGHQGDLMVEGYYMYTKGGGFEGMKVDHMHSVGVLFGASYPTGWFKRLNTHFDLCWGFVYNNIATRDLDSSVNSTPSVGVGVRWRRWDATVRWYHQSNGGTRGNNQGFNSLQYLVSYRL